MNDLDLQIQEQFSKLPAVIRSAITSADMSQHLRDLADSHKLHLDQWERLENEVMLTLLGIQPAENLEKNIVSEVGVSAEIAQSLARDISANVFEPIREELERQLEHPDAQVKEVSGVETARERALASAQPVASSLQPAADTDSGATGNKLQATSSSAPIVQPATPPTPVPDTKVTRPSESSLYKPGETSAARATVHDDPYRESPL